MMMIIKRFISIITLLLLCLNANANQDNKTKLFTSDWFSGNIPYWNAYKDLFSGLPNKRCLEIGAYEGRSTLYLVENYCNGKGSYVDSVDTWEGSMEHNATNKKDLYNRYVNNLKPYIEAKKVNIYRGLSSDILIKFAQEVRDGKREKYDFIYIDASHLAKDVLMDAVLSWELLKDDGLMFFDDYNWTAYQDKPWLRPKVAIDGFLDSYATRYELLEKNYQVRIKKLGEANYKIPTSAEMKN